MLMFRMDAKTLLVEQMTRGAKVFLKALEDFPEEKFHADLASGGHSVAWHALHIADWTQILVPAHLRDVDSKLRFMYLGWEEADFAKSVYEIGFLTAQSRKSEIIYHVKTQLERAALDLLEADAALLERTVQTPMGERKLLAIIMTHVAHVPYHYGQVKLNAKQLL
jgi:uncharacterized damage-inducible protein DinB